MKKTNKKGFTIVELVIVIAVIAILSAVLIPTFAGVTTNAKKSAALQEARNAYTEEVAEDAASLGGDFIYVSANGYAYAIVDGNFVEENNAPKCYEVTATNTVAVIVESVFGAGATVSGTTGLLAVTIA